MRYKGIRALRRLESERVIILTSVGHPLRNRRDYCPLIHYETGLERRSPNVCEGCNVATAAIPHRVIVEDGLDHKEPNTRHFPLVGWVGLLMSHEAHVPADICWSIKSETCHAQSLDYPQGPPLSFTQSIIVHFIS